MKEETGLANKVEGIERAKSRQRTEQKMEHDGRECTPSAAQREEDRGKALEMPRGCKGGRKSATLTKTENQKDY